MTTFLEYEKQVREEFYLDWPEIAETFGWQDLCFSWQMEYWERTSLIGILQAFRPSVSIEVGTHTGGSLAVISRYSHRVYSLDIDPQSSQFLQGKFPNVEYVVGDSKKTLPPVLTQVEKHQDGPVFVFIDGDHSQNGVLTDLTNVLRFKPQYPMILMGHDCFNPECRSGVLKAPWSSNPHVQLVEIDFVLGSIFNRGYHKMQMWDGFYFASLTPEKRSHQLKVSQRHELLYNLTLKQSAHKPSLRKLLGRLAERARQAVHARTQGILNSTTLRGA